jgi:predicted DsbA family dithiol-disulfide isomerase
MLQWLYTYVSSVCSDCFICFRRMSQVFHLDVAKVDLDIAYT